MWVPPKTFQCFLLVQSDDIFPSNSAQMLQSFRTLNRSSGRSPHRWPHFKTTPLRQRTFWMLPFQKPGIFSLRPSHIGTVFFLKNWNRKLWWLWGEGKVNLEEILKSVKSKRSTKRALRCWEIRSSQPLCWMVPTSRFQPWLFRQEKKAEVFFDRDLRFWSADPPCKIQRMETICLIKARRFHVQQLKMWTSWTLH